MSPSTDRQTIKYEKDLDPHFADEIAAEPGCADLRACIQCGTCSGGCPVSSYMDYAPRRIIAMTRSGFKDEVLRSTTVWLCASCYNCTVECPKQIKITDIMYALKQRAIRDGRYPGRFPVPVLAREFFNMIKRYGRSHESELLVRMYLKTNPFKMLNQAFFALKLFQRGRMAIFPEKIRARHGGHGDLNLILGALDRKETGV